MMALLMMLLFHALFSGGLGEVVEDKSLRQQRNGMLGVYFNPQDPVSRLAAIWWSKFFEKFPDARPDASSKPATTLRPIAERPTAENGVTTQPGDTQTGKPLPIGWIYPMPVFPGSSFPIVSNGGQIQYIPYYPLPSGQGQQIVPWQPSPPLVNPQTQYPPVNPQIPSSPVNPQIPSSPVNPQIPSSPVNPQIQPAPYNPQNQPPSFNSQNQQQNAQQNQNFNQGTVTQQQQQNYQGSQQVQNFGQAPATQQQQPMYPSNQPSPGQQVPQFNPNVGQTPVQQQQQQFGNQAGIGGQNTQSQLNTPNPQNGDQPQSSGGQNFAQGMQQYPSLPAGGQFPPNQQQYPNPGQQSQSQQYQKPPSPGAGAGFPPPTYPVPGPGVRGQNEFTLDSISVNPMTYFQFANITDGFLRTMNDTNATAARTYQDDDSNPNVQLIPLRSMLLVFPVHAGNSTDGDTSSSGFVSPVVDALGPGAIITAECDDKNGTLCAQNDLNAIGLSRAVNEFQQ